MGGGSAGGLGVVTTWEVAEVPTSAELAELAEAENRLEVGGVCTGGGWCFGLPAAGRAAACPSARVVGGSQSTTSQLESFVSPASRTPKNPLYHALELRFPGFMHMAVPSDTRTLSWNPLTRGLRCLRDKADWIGAIEFTTAGGWSSTPIRGTSYCDNPLTGAPYLRPGPRRWVRRQERQPLDRRPAR